MGKKSAQRLAFHFLSQTQDVVDQLAETMVRTRRNIRYCDTCFNISLSERCHICSDAGRDEHVLCVVSEPRDVFSVERTHHYHGHYHVLGGLISPLDGIHPEVLRIQELVERLRSGTFTEIILAINPTVEGDATLLYLNSVLASFQIKTTKLAYGLPMGGDIEYADELTLQQAFHGRTGI